MAKKIIIFQGTNESPDSAWFQYVKNNVADMEVLTPELPNPAEPSVETTLPFALENFEYDADTILIGHSSGVPLILGILEQIENPIKQAILVAGFMSPISDAPKPILKSSYDVEKIRSNCSDFVIINSDDDPWNCDIEKGLEMRDAFGGTLVAMTGQGHFGSLSYNQPYKEFPLLLKLIAD